eukprot:gnl/TRDRNA2_/TRDRNA2_146983_c0_seq3.p1 gnl/TRDRNA2_/TRDRNA2_146983_c0~~gnl/TRDRNA2_/TRDRNA2_146983_c0_seq3.p1  ORF type:complete len:128 (-),score=16.70 gnl/TRDRNA2_/TRDRNA2_146983_c0_seq3:84-467(-)
MSCRLEQTWFMVSWFGIREKPDVTVTEMGRNVWPREPMPLEQASAPTISVTVPEGMYAGSALSVVTPDGQTLQAVVPLGLAPGDVFLVQVPPPVEVANPTVVGAAANDGDDDFSSDEGNRSCAARQG